jgi:hypothetical protein
MASFPTEWSVYDHQLYASYTVHDLHDAPLGMNMLMKLGPDGHSLGNTKSHCSAAAQWTQNIRLQ